MDDTNSMILSQEEYEAARFELLEEIARGTSIEDLRAKITKKSEGNKTEKQSPPEQKSKIPDELVQVQAYIRWEKAGKPSYSADQQLVGLKFLFYMHFLFCACTSN